MHRRRTPWRDRLPFAQVEDVDAATAQAEGLGATLVQPRVEGPMGAFTVVQDPGGGRVALWQSS